jgi:hypothetical protein
MRLACVSSVARMAMDEMHTTMRAQYPSIAAVRRNINRSPGTQFFVTAGAP